MLYYSKFGKNFLQAIHHNVCNTLSEQDQRVLEKYFLQDVQIVGVIFQTCPSIIELH